MTIPNSCSPSTTFVWKKVKIEPPARPQVTARAQRARSALRPEPLPKPLPRKTTGVLVKYRGGAEAFWEISHSGRTVRVPGWWQLHDAMRLVFEGQLRDGDET